MGVLSEMAECRNRISDSRARLRGREAGTEERLEQITPLCKDTG